MSIGEKIIEGVGRLVTIYDSLTGAPMDRPVIFVWSPVATEQLEAVVEAHIEERVRVRLELDRQRDRETIERIIFLGDDLCKTLQEESQFIDKTASMIYCNPPPLHMMTSKMRADAWGIATCGLRKKPDEYPAD